MKYTPSPLFLIFILLVISGFLSVCEACEEDMEQIFIDSINAECEQDWFLCVGEKK